MSIKRLPIVYIAVLMPAILLLSCKNKPIISETIYAPPYVNVISNEFDDSITLERVLLDKQENSIRKNIFRLQEKTEMFSIIRMGNKEKKQIIKILKPGTKIVILARSIFGEDPGESIYLVSFKGDKVSWRGWINGNAIIEPHILIDNIIGVSGFSVSLSNDAIVIENTEEEKIHIIGNKWNEIAQFRYQRYSDSMFQEKYPENSIILGWDSKDNVIWFSTHFCEIPLSFGMINLEQKTILQLTAPKDVNYYDYKFDLDNGIYYYITQIDENTSQLKCFNIATNALGILKTTEKGKIVLSIDEQGKIVY